MKLRNKKTGEIKDVRMSYRNDTAPIVVSETTKDDNGQSQGWAYYSLAELNEEWEDVSKKSKGYWYYDSLSGYVEENPDPLISDLENDKVIGNYFETREEAEKAVEKLKAWKRLKDKGFSFESVSQGIAGGEIRYKVNEESFSVMKDLDLLFGGKE